MFTLDEIVQLTFDFENLVRQRNADLILPSGSPIENAALAALSMLEGFKRDLPKDSHHDHRQEWRQAVALGDTLRKVMRVKDHPSFDELWPHLMLLLGDGNIALNLWNPSTDADANKVFELYLALLLAPLSDRLELDDPVRSSGGNNPDVIAQLDGSRWALACKVMHSPSPKTFLDRVREGIDQIRRSKADKGIVVISLKNLLSHDEIWTMKANSDIWNLLMPGPVHPEIARRMFVRLSEQYYKQVVDELLGGPKAFREMFENTQAVPAVLLHFCSTICTTEQAKPNLHLMRMLATISVDPIQPDLFSILDRMNDSMQGHIPMNPAQFANPKDQLP